MASSNAMMPLVTAVEGETKPNTKPTPDQIIAAPIDYLLSLPGKDLRGRLIAAFDEWLHVPPDKLDLIRRVIELLHTASLLIDDIQDSSNLRRGQPVAHSIFGIASTINSANYAYFEAQHELHKLNDPRAIQIFTEELLRLHRGQGMDLYWRDSLTCPSEEEYFDMVADKTGGLFRLAIKLMQCSSTSTYDYVPLVNLMGIIFQIRDDYQNLQSGTYICNKGFGEDLTEGKFSFPIIHAIRHGAQRLQLLSILKQKTEDVTVKRYAIGVMEAAGSFDYCRVKIAELAAEARLMLQEIAGSTTGKDTSGGKGVAEFLDVLEIK
ncbi:geranylgeranyl pyrophosphate synthase spyE [Aspergillus homomorphus CBS 101889]|uniref:(2E,6E)-farnesyl diphosphate synthase n=1 Tax=Aspergillus homomorphus (strain CBS 101889) TaxID=1450537 RepID=A0A395I1P0_ASPHC|nr:putative geranyl geranyl pyrophosphate synthase [Aspergillus homomorphus CBS 101889]RAL12474.1 putative geranyl geranyl pyrophosphate synthase [Aspergillus homomorphus CBS 101889]